MYYPKVFTSLSSTQARKETHTQTWYTVEINLEGCDVGSRGQRDGSRWYQEDRDLFYKCDPGDLTRLLSSLIFYLWGWFQILASGSKMQMIH